MIAARRKPHGIGGIAQQREPAGIGSRHVLERRILRGGVGAHMRQAKNPLKGQFSVIPASAGKQIVGKRLAFVNVYVNINVNCCVNSWIGELPAQPILALPRTALGKRTVCGLGANGGVLE